jgi:hypothetical protein
VRDGLDPEAHRIDDFEHHLAGVDGLPGDDVGGRDHAADRGADLLAFGQRGHQLLALLAKCSDLAFRFVDPEDGQALMPTRDQVLRERRVSPSGKDTKAPEFTFHDPRKSPKHELMFGHEPASALAGGDPWQDLVGHYASRPQSL